MAQPPQVRFLNHASLAFDAGGGVLLHDPWLWGRAFADSWTLRASTPVDVDFRRVRWIWISHEHSDHLHFPTLRRLRDQIPGDVEVLFLGASSTAVASAIDRIGFAFRPVRDRERVVLHDDLAVTTFAAGHDAAAVVEVSGRVVFNQNDARFSARALREIRSRYGRIDAWFCQFSLAGWHGNVDEPDALAAARRAHLRRIGDDHRILEPGLFVPFASFAAFCRPTNAWMNRWGISVAELLAEWPSMRSQTLFPGDILRFDEHGGDEDAVARWEAAFAGSAPLVPHRIVPDEELLAAGDAWLRRILPAAPRGLRPAAFAVALDERRSILLDPHAGKVTLHAGSAPAPCVVEAPADLVVNLLRHPYGADTLHISACLRVIDRVRWRRILQFHVAVHKYAERSGAVRWLVCAAEKGREFASRGLDVYSKREAPPRTTYTLPAPLASPIAKSS